MLQVLVAISQSFVVEKRHGYAKVIHKKIKKEMRKNGQVSKIFKTIGT